MVSSAEHGIRFKSYHLPCHRNAVLGYARMREDMRRQKQKSPQLRGLKSDLMRGYATMRETHDHSHSIIYSTRNQLTENKFMKR